MKCDKCGSEISDGLSLLLYLRSAHCEAQYHDAHTDWLQWVERMIELEKKDVPWPPAHIWPKQSENLWSRPLQPFNPPQETTPQVTPECTPGPTTPDPKYTDHTLSNKNTFKE